MDSESRPNHPGPLGGGEGWYPDPSGRHESRYWDGLEWTNNVRSQGAVTIESTDPSVPGGAVTSESTDPPGFDSASTVDQLGAPSAGAPPNIQAPAKPAAHLSGFWRRSFAFVLDGLLLGAAGFVLGVFLFDPLARLGGWGRLVGFCIALGYFGLLNSGFGGGRTLGKRVMRIHVVDTSGRNVSVGRSCLRFAVVGAPFFFNGFWFAWGGWKAAFQYVVAFGLWGLGAAVLYLYLFNRRTRQGLHDLVAGTFVVRTGSVGRVEGSFWRPHVAIMLGLLLVVGVGAIVVPTVIARHWVYPELLRAQKGIASTGKVRSSSVMAGKSWGGSGGGHAETRFLSVRVVWKTPPGDYLAAAHEVAAIALQEFPAGMEMDYVSVVVSYGFDLGIASSWRSQGFQFDPAAVPGAPAYSPGVAPAASRSGTPGIDRLAALAFSDAAVTELIAGESARLYALMEQGFRESVSEREFRASVERIFGYGGRPLESEFKTDEVGYKDYPDGTRKPARKFWYAVRTDRAEKGTYFLFVEVVPDGGGLACTAVSIVSFPQGVPDSFR